MNIPVILDITLGLILIYLVLSLLASELQELIGTLLQWRAEHLKKSIELLLSGDRAAESATGQLLANVVYDSPLIQSLNQEGQGPIIGRIRRVTQIIGQAYRWVTQTRNTFGNQHSGPSYIPAETFASTLLDTLDLRLLGRCLTTARLQRFAEEQLWLPVRRIVADLRASLGDDFVLQAELQELEQRFTQILTDFNQQRTSLIVTVDRLLNQIDTFATLTQQHLQPPDPRVEIGLKRLATVRQWLAQDEDEKRIILKQIEPSLSELVAVFDRRSKAYQECLAILQQGRLPAETLPELHRLLSQFDAEQLSEHLRANLYRLVERLDSEAAGLDDKLATLKAEVSVWFDHAMERAAGVYQRNARGVAVLIGVAIAITLNADTFYMVSRLAKDPVIRSSLTQSATQFVPSGDVPVAETLATLRDAVDNLITDLPIPMGRSELVLRMQAADEQDWRWPLPRHYLGWLVSGIAISMGSSFWFKLIGKVLDIRNTGEARPPDRPTATAAPERRP